MDIFSKAVTEVIDQLPPVEREVVNALFYEGLTLQATADRLRFDHAKQVQRVRDTALRRVRAAVLQIQEDVDLA